MIQEPLTTTTAGSPSHSVKGAGCYCSQSGNFVFGGNFRKFSLIVIITDNIGTSVDLDETMRATPMSTISHKNDVLVLRLVHY